MTITWIFPISKDFGHPDIRNENDRNSILFFIFFSIHFIYFYLLKNRSPPIVKCQKLKTNNSKNKNLSTMWGHSWQTCSKVLSKVVINHKRMRWYIKGAEREKWFHPSKNTIPCKIIPKNDGKVGTGEMLSS